MRFFASVLVHNAVALDTDKHSYSVVISRSSALFHSIALKSKNCKTNLLEIGNLSEISFKAVQFGRMFRKHFNQRALRHGLINASQKPTLNYDITLRGREI